MNPSGDKQRRTKLARAILEVIDPTSCVYVDVHSDVAETPRIRGEFFASQWREMADALLESSASSSCAARDTVIDECRDAAHDAIHHAVERMDLCAFVKGHVDEALVALKCAPVPESGQINAAGQEESSEEAVVKPAQDAARTPAPAAPTPQGTPRTNGSRKSAPCVGSSW